MIGGTAMARMSFLLIKYPCFLISVQLGNGEVVQDCDNEKRYMASSLLSKESGDGHDVCIFIKYC